MQYDTKKERLTLLLKSFTAKGRLLILTHNNPDPDSLASAYAFKFLLKKTLGKEADIRFGGLVGRAENKAMIQQLRIPVLSVEKSNFSKYSHIAVLDTQPGAGNNSLPKGLIPTVVRHQARLRCHDHYNMGIPLRGRNRAGYKYRYCHNLCHRLGNTGPRP
jgi:nanoRNase/pAp phosphatase (c-di-AMP/oligoRNAs hydrolase)